MMCDLSDLARDIETMYASGVTNIQLTGADLTIIAAHALSPTVLETIRLRKHVLLKLLRSGARYPFTEVLKGCTQTSPDARQSPDRQSGVEVFHRQEADQAFAPGTGLPTEQCEQNAVLRSTMVEEPPVPVSECTKKGMQPKTQKTQKPRKYEMLHQDKGNGTSVAARKKAQKDTKIGTAELPYCPHPWHELHYLQQALQAALPDPVKVLLDVGEVIYPAPLRLRLRRRDQSLQSAESVEAPASVLDIPMLDLARITGPHDPALATNIVCVIKIISAHWSDLGVLIQADAGEC